MLHQSFSSNIRKYSYIKQLISELCQGGGGKIYGVRVENKANAMIVYYVHLNIIPMSEMKYNYTSITEKVLYFEATQKRFCIGCIRHL